MATRMETRREVASVTISSADTIRVESASGLVTVFFLQVQHTSGASWITVRRFRDFRLLRRQLADGHPEVMGLPFPRRNWLARLSPEVITQRQELFQAFLAQLLELRPLPQALLFFLEVFDHERESFIMAERGASVVVDMETGDLLDEAQLMMRQGEIGRVQDKFGRGDLGKTLGMLGLQRESEETLLAEALQETKGSRKTSEADGAASAATADASAPVPRRTAPRPEDFVLLRSIDQGSFGRISFARGVGAPEDQLYAMKVLSKDDVARRIKRAGIATAACKILEGVRHPYLVQLRFAFQTEKKIYLLLDACTGGPLFDHLKRFGDFSESATHFYAAQLVLAIECLHRHDLVCENLTPKNLLLDSDGHLKLTDFAFVKASFGRTRDPAASDATRPEKSHTPKASEFRALPVGSVEYQAPEMVQDPGGPAALMPGPGVDWWAVGVILYEMAVGLPAFYDPDYEAMCLKILHWPVGFPRRAKAPANLRNLIGGLLEKDPAARLGRSGADVKRHTFFAGLAWDALEMRQLPAPELVLPRAPSIMGAGDDGFRPSESRGSRFRMSIHDHLALAPASQDDMGLQLRRSSVVGRFSLLSSGASDLLPALAESPDALLHRSASLRGGGLTGRRSSLQGAF